MFCKKTRGKRCRHRCFCCPLFKHILNDFEHGPGGGYRVLWTSSHARWDLGGVGRLLRSLKNLLTWSATKDMGLNIPQTCSHGRCFLEGKGLGGSSVPWTCANGWCWDDFNFHWTCWHVPCYRRQRVAGVILTFLELAHIVDAAEHMVERISLVLVPLTSLFHVLWNQLVYGAFLTKRDLASACRFNCKEPRGVFGNGNETKTEACDKEEDVDRK